MTICFDFEYANVGQGLFHYGSINEFNYIYDCGGSKEKYLSNALNNFYMNCIDENINLLIISHFHDDHVRGLDSLFENKTVETVILPYISMEERLFLSFKKGYTNFELLANPALYFFNKGVKQVIIINQNDQGGKLDRGNEDTPKPNDDEILKLDFKLMEPDKQLKDQLLDESPDLKEYNSKLLVYNHFGTVRLGVNWIFKFFNLSRNYSEIQNFKKMIRDILKTDLVNSNQLKNLLYKKEDRVKIKKCYDQLKGNFNNTSLCCFHSPINVKYSELRIKNINEWIYFPRISRSYFNEFKRFYPVGHMLSGDISLLRNAYKEFIDHYQLYLSLIGIFLLPHHGSVKNWNKKLLQAMKYKIFWVASAGISNKFSHPGLSVIEDILSYDHYFLYSNEFTITQGYSLVDFN